MPDPSTQTSKSNHLTSFPKSHHTLKMTTHHQRNNTTWRIIWPKIVECVGMISHASASCCQPVRTSQSPSPTTVAECATKVPTLKSHRKSRTVPKIINWTEVTYCIAYLVTRVCRSFLHRRIMFRIKWARVWSATDLSKVRSTIITEWKTRKIK